MTTHAPITTQTKTLAALAAALDRIERDVTRVLRHHERTERTDMATITWGEFAPAPALQRAILGVLAAAAAGEAIPLVVRLREAPRDSIVAVGPQNWHDSKFRMIVHPSTRLPASLREQYETPQGGQR